MKILNQLYDKKNDKPILTSYRVIGNEIEMFYANYDSKRIPYSKQSEKELVDSLKENALTLIRNMELFEKEFNKESMYVYLSAALAVLNAYLLSYHLQKGNEPIVINALAIFFSTLFVIDFIKAANNNGLAYNDALKYQYFLENEDTINLETIKRYKEFYGEDAPLEDVNRMTINDLDNYTLEDLQHIVETIQTDEEYQLKKA